MINDSVIILRLPLSIRMALEQRAKNEGTTISKVVRSIIDDYISKRSPHAPTSNTNHQSTK
jgi:predicted DNA-binding protein